MTDEDDRRDVRSEAEGAVPNEKQAVTPGEDAAEDRANGSAPGAGGAAGDMGASRDEDGSDAPAEESGKDGKQGSFWKELPILIGVALVLALVIKAFAVQAFYIPSASMENTLQIGDRVLVNKIVYHTRDVRRGDIVVFNGLDSWDPEVQVAEPTNPISKAFHWIGGAFGVVPGEKDYIKRVIGTPGDHVKCCDSQGRMTVNGAPLDERSYLFTDPVTGERNKPSNEPFDVTVQPGNLWVMGDHREVSYDSRQHRGDPGGGAIPENRVIGRAFVIVWPVNRIGTLPIPKTFEQPALNAAGALLPATPFALGLAGAIPITLLNRRLRLRLRRTRRRLTP
ncbi:signal peptidase I Serine peptidase. MEROPS family S26A [Thermomonospora echinospora]|uniref:Signal peptidase I n=1 Tax=Thermomonospora echinospora TaxID=1992 RepID=A0A1H6DQS3_9ACTN|nr:signal peptidase I [Thermomonospora echinospora]SEG87023.1 signal peptidase I Serine peptidase. MEROPS family S26A [Thermomonospora echinospora]